MRRVEIAVVLIFASALMAWGQTNRLGFTWTQGPEVLRDGSLLPSAFAGGADMPQWSKIDLNHDGHADLVAFDRQGNRWITYLYENAEWINAPNYADSLPHVQNWGLFRDFNNDGKQDLFAFVLGGMGVWENTSTANRLEFTWALQNAYLETNVGTTISNLYNLSSDIPAIVDLDDDGDLDVLTFGQRSTVEWHEGLTQNALDFAMNTTCWGRFEENLASNNLTLNGCQGIQKVELAGKNSGAAHAGSTILALNLNGDTLKDLLIGDVSFTNLVAAYNGGHRDSAFITSKDTLYPSSSPSNIEYFPAAYYEDVNFDSVPDLIVSPNLNGSINQENVWLYENVGTADMPSYQSIDSAFLVDGMIDIGSTSRPSLVDLDFDGDFDLVVGGKGSYIAPGVYQSSLHLYTNIGSNVSPKFELTDSDFVNAGFNNLGEDLSPTFGDLDGDFDPDLIIGALNGLLYYYENTGTIVNPSFTYRGAIQSIDVGNHSTPSLGDLDGDGDLDLVVGNEAGTVAYYEKTGTFPTLFTLVSSNWVGIDMSSSTAPSGYSVPVVLYGADTTLLIGSEDLGVVQKDSLRTIMNGVLSSDMFFDDGTTSSATREQTPFGGSKRNGRTQLLFTADELIAEGGTYGQISSIGFEIGTNSSTYLTQGFTIRLKHVSDTSLSTFQNQGFSTVYDGIRVMTTGWNDVPFTTPFVWNGSDHLLVEICFSKNAQTGDIPVIIGATTHHSFFWGDVNGWNGITNDGCQMPFGGKSKLRPNTRFNITPILRDVDTHFLSSGRRLHPAVADLNADGYPDVILGNQAGGLNYFEGTQFNSIGTEEELAILYNWEVFPNPASQSIRIEVPSDGEFSVRLYDIQGRFIRTLETSTQLELTVPKGIYVIRISGDHGTYTDAKKLIIL